MKHYVLVVAGLLGFSTWGWAGGPGVITTAGEFVNRTGVGVNDLHVHVTNPVGVYADNSGPIGANTQSLDFAFAPLNPGENDTFFTITPLDLLGLTPLGNQIPMADSYFWTVDGIQQGAQVNPVIANLGFDSLTSIYSLSFTNPDPVDTYFEAQLQIDGFPILGVSTPVLLPASSTTPIVAQFSFATTQTLLLAWENGGIDSPELGPNSNLLADSLQVVAVTGTPEPGTIVLFGAGLAGVIFARRRRHRA
jgi:hypothetical protein